MKTKSLSIFFWLIASLFTALGLYNSVKANFQMIGISADMCDTVMIWYGVQEYGWKFVKFWIYNQDNWLFSLFSFHFLLFKFLKPTASVVYWATYIIFLGNLLICGLIAKSLKASYSIGLVPIILLCTGFFAFRHGFLTYPVSHNITNFYGLLSLLFTLYWAKNQRLYWLILIFLASVIGGLSDPWQVPSYIIPISCTALVFLLFYPHLINQKSSRQLIVSISLAAIAIYTKFFGLFPFLQKTSFHLASPKTIFMHIGISLRDIGWLLNFIPGKFNYTLVAVILSLLIIFSLIGLLIFKIKQNLPLDSTRITFFLFIAFSLMISLGIFCLYSGSVGGLPDYDSGRYLLNILFILILGITITAELYWDNLSKLSKSIVMILGLFYATAGITSNFYLWKSPINLNSSDYYKLSNFLTTHHLNYGYASYGTANVMTWLSQNKLRVRTVNFSKKNGFVFLGNQIQTSKLWYLPEDAPRNQHYFFIYLGRADYECPNMEICINGLTQQFGKPVNKIQYQNDYILVWDHAITIPP